MADKPAALDPKDLATQLNKMEPGDSILVKDFPLKPEARASKLVLGGRQFSVLRTEAGYRIRRMK